MLTTLLLLASSQESQGILKLTANAWNRLSRHEKMNWDEAARLDKTRYEGYIITSFAA
jgi:hypothetical protein